MVLEIFTYFLSYIKTLQTDILNYREATKYPMIVLELLKPFKKNLLECMTSTATARRTYYDCKNFGTFSQHWKYDIDFLTLFST